MTYQYYLYQNNHIKHLLKDNISMFQSSNPLDETHTILLQNRHMQKWFSLKLAHLNKISFNLNFNYPVKLMREIIIDFENIEDILKKKQLIFEDDLFFLILKELDSLKNSMKTNALINYIYQSKTKITTEKKKIIIAQKTAHIIFKYLEQDPQYIKIKSSKLNDILLLQYQIYQNIFEKKPFISIPHIIQHIIEQKLNYSGNLKTISIFGSSFLSQYTQDFFYYMSQFIRVNQYLFTPSKSYLYPSINDDSLTTKYWFLPLNHHLSNLKNKKIKSIHQSFHELNENTLLNNFKKIMIGENIEKICLDDSLQIVKTPTKKREVEMVKDKILNTLNNNNEIQLTDICVLAPNINDYYPFILQIFKEEKTPISLSYNIIDIQITEKSKLIQGFIQILELPFSKFDINSIISICSNDYFLKANDLTHKDLELFLEIIKKYNVKWGFNEEHKKELQFGYNKYSTFDQAFSRIYEIIISGMDLEEEIYIQKETKETLNKWVEIISDLYKDIQYFQKKMNTLNEWGTHLIKLINRYLKPMHSLSDDEEQEFNLMYRIVSELYQIEKDIQLSDKKLYKDNLFSIFSVIEFIKLALKKENKRQGHYLSTGVTFSSINPFRNIPFKYIFLIGFNEDSFQDISKKSTLDYTYQDRDILQQKQYHQFSFIETLFSAEKQLILSYQGINPLNNKEIEPSQIILQVIHLLSQSKSISVQINKQSIQIKNIKELKKHWIEELPFNNFDQNNFIKTSKTHSFNQKGFELFTYKNSPFNSPVTLSFQKETPPAINLKQVIGFVQTPIKQYFQDSLLLYIREDNLNDLSENIDISSLTNYSMKQKLNANTHSISIEGIKNIFSYYKDNSEIPPMEQFSKTKEQELFDHYSTLEAYLSKNYSPYQPISLDCSNNSTQDIPPLYIKDMDIHVEYHLTNAYKHNKTIILTVDSSKIKHNLSPFIIGYFILLHPSLDIEQIHILQIDKNLTINQFILTKETTSTNYLKSLIEFYLHNLEQPILIYPDAVLSLIKNPVEKKVQEYFSSSQEYPKDFHYDTYSKYYLGHLETILWTEQMNNFLFTIYEPIINFYGKTYLR